VCQDSCPSEGDGNSRSDSSHSDRLVLIRLIPSRHVTAQDRPPAFKDSTAAPDPNFAQTPYKEFEGTQRNPKEREEEGSAFQNLQDAAAPL
jgi:hypothetical protein